MQIAVDGPAGSGKSVISKIIAKRYGLLYLDTGAMYRAVAWLKLNGRLSDEGLLETLHRTEFNFSENGNRLILSYNLSGARSEDVTDMIRTQEVTALVSDVAANAEIRAILTKIQRQIASGTDVILDGRDIGTVVLPNADLKFFLTASEEERAKRRTEEWKIQGKTANYETVLNNMRERDAKDSSRDIAPLTKSNDAIEIDTTGLTINEVTAIIDAAINVFLNSAEG